MSLIVDVENSPGEPEDEGRKDDAGKLRYDLIPPDALRKIVEVITHGSRKYGDNNWHMVLTEADGVGVNRYFAALQRHAWQWREGERVDPPPYGSDVDHMAHVACCALFLLCATEAHYWQACDSIKVHDRSKTCH